MLNQQIILQVSVINMINKKRVSFAVLFLLSTLLAIQPPVAQAQQQKKAETELVVQNNDSATNLTQSTQAQIDELKRLEEELNLIRQDLDKATGDDQLALTNRSLQVKANYRKTMQQLLKTLIDQKEDGVDATEIVEKIEQPVKRLAQGIRKDIESVQKEIEQLRAQQEKAAPEQTLKIQEALSSALDQNSDLIMALFEHSEKMMALGLDAGDDLRYLDTLLQERAKSIAGRIEVFLDKIKKAEKRAVKATDDEKKSIAVDLQLLSEKKQSNAKSLALIIDVMNKRNLDATPYSQLLIVATGEISGDIFDRKVVAGLTQQWVESLQEWAKENGPTILLKAIVIIFILLLFKLISNLFSRVVRRALSASKLHISQLLQDFFINLSGKAVMVVGLLVALSQIGVEIGPLLAGLGVIGFILGFALQETLSNFASGLMILIYRPYDIGNTIEAGGVMGKVQEMNMVATTIMTPDNQKLVVPNNKIWGGVIRNVTAQSKRRVDMVFGIGYGDDMAKAETILTSIIEADSRVLKDPAPVIKVHTLGESSVDFIVRPWVSTVDYWDVYWDITRKVKEQFDANEVSIPFPQRDIHIIGNAQ
ncbi:MAG: mechanosensitive ion channel [Sedimenticola sp.]|uniref:Small-conductance mechanosensitive channel n=1 Tax=Sedimenticola thiotaurini TaxID=1543721 RepID=A0A558CJE0_9GAMM|nr:mechanosensitive ion channel [Sedimenticola sp.]MCW8919968.1 mechanosensitive ion channel [Sedimenticola sp.]MCW8946823.1 mechanosensitive ion channel [Sedimenticola sp.]MCW8974125.1 mechanosensitive ion channel [Sedimenticola sp.]TVT48854.1 MAG: mechanosensitive ion channel [Sedimenticola thiotaurini]